MWIFTTGGFVSVVADKDDVNCVLVRTRDRESLQTLLDGVELIAGTEAPSVRVGEGTDYPYRATVNREDFAAWIVHEVMNYITYPNFKSAVRDSRGEAWSHALMRTWIAMLDVTDPEVAGTGYGAQTALNPHYATNRLSEGYLGLLDLEDDSEASYDDLEPHTWSSRARDWSE